MSDLTRYQKQTLFSGIGPEGQRKLSQARVLLCGCGALGSVVADQLTRAGIGFIRLADRDFVELSNLQRQTLFDEIDLKEQLPKAIAAARKLKNINSQVRVEPHSVDINSGNILSLVADVDLILDGTDNFETRLLINDVSLEKNIPWIHAGCQGSGGQVMLLDPGKTPCFRCLVSDVSAGAPHETCDTVGVIGPAVTMAASVQVTLALQHLVQSDQAIHPELVSFDIWKGRYRRHSLKKLRETNVCPACQQGERAWLFGKRQLVTSALCGRNAVQVCPTEPNSVSLEQLADRLATIGNVTQTPYLLRFQPYASEQWLTIFPDGRTIVQGTESGSTAKSLYAKYVGH